MTQEKTSPLHERMIEDMRNMTNTEVTPPTYYARIMALRFQPVRRPR